MRFTFSANNYNRFFWVGKMMCGTTSIILLFLNLAIIINLVFEKNIKAKTLTISGVSLLLFLTCVSLTCLSHRQNKKFEMILSNQHPGKAGNP